MRKLEVKGMTIYSLGWQYLACNVSFKQTISNWSIKSKISLSSNFSARPSTLKDEKLILFTNSYNENEVEICDWEGKWPGQAYVWLLSREFVSLASMSAPFLYSCWLSDMDVKFGIQMGQICDFLRSISVIFGSTSQNVL